MNTGTESGSPRRTLRTKNLKARVKTVVCEVLRFLPVAGCWLLAISVANSQDVLTFHNDVARTGQNLNELTLTPANVYSPLFGRLFTITVDGKVDAQPLYVSEVRVRGKGTHNLLIVASEHGSVYAFDADTGGLIWRITTLKIGEVPSDPLSCREEDGPEIGITATPVIDRARGGNGAIYLIAMSKDRLGTYFQRLHALDLTTGEELLGGPQDVQATYPGTGDNSINGFVIFDAKQYKERAGLLLLNGLVYTAWASHCDHRPYTGWIMGYNASTLTQMVVLDVVPNGGQGSIWMAGAGLAADASANLYLLDANGDFGTALDANGFPANHNFGNAFLKLSTASGLAVADYFEMYNEQEESDTDQDLGSGGTLVLPDMTDSSGTVRHLAVGAGKDGNIYLVNRDSMGKFSPTSNNVYQELASALPGGVFSTPAYYNGHLYYGANNGPISAFRFSNARLSSTPVAQTANFFNYPGATPSVSANGNTNGIIWATEDTNPAVLHAYNATNLQELYNSNQASGGRDHFGAGNNFITPTIAAGKVYVATRTGVGVFGTLGTPVPALAFSPEAGTYNAPVSVTISDLNRSAQIHYTTDGSTPTVFSPVFRNPIMVSTTTTIEAISVAGGISSIVASGTYTIQ